MPSCFLTRNVGRLPGDSSRGSALTLKISRFYPYYYKVALKRKRKRHQKGTRMKLHTKNHIPGQRHILRRTFAGLLAAATLVCTLPGGLTPVYAAQTQKQSLKTLGVIDTPGEEDTANDLPDLTDIPAAQASLQTADNGDMIIAIDAGHGGSDAGATYDGMKEKDVNLKIAQYIKAYFADYAGVQIYLTRDSDTAVELSTRVEQAAAAGADVFISIHNNASSNEKTSGSMVFYPNNNYRPALGAEGAELSQSILDQLTALGLPDLGIRTRNSENNTKYKDGSLADYYSVIRNAKLQNMTGIIVEHAFVSCASDRKNYLGTDAQLQKLARADVKGIADYYGLEYIGLTKPAVTLSAPGYKQLAVEWDEQEDARGYLVYRSEKKNSGYKKIATVTGGYNTSYVDTGLALNKDYYYKVKAYRKIDGVTYYSAESRILKGNVIGGTQFTEIKQTGDNFRLTWKAMSDADGYVISRSEDGGSYVRIAEIDDPSRTTYTDRDVFSEISYRYRIRPLHYLYNNEGYGKMSTVVTLSYLDPPEIKNTTARTDGKVKVTWSKVSGASQYVLQRSDSENGTYKTVATLKGEETTSYIDTKVEIAKEYYYRVKAYNEHGIVKGSSYYSDALDAFNFRTPEFTNVAISNKTPGVSLTWSKTPFAEGYRIYRSETEDGGYTRIGTVKGSSTVTYLDTSGTDIGTTYYYKVRAYVTKSKKTVLSYVSDPRAITPGYAIMGESSTTAAKMANWYTARGGVYPEEIYSEYGAPTLKDFCKLVYNEAKAEGVKAEVLFAQICKETGFLKFGGDVQPDQCNFGGIGATGGGAAGASFPDVQTGIRAQVQHLKAYASDQPLNKECVDPRFTYVDRCAAIYVEWLGVHENPTGAGWATGKNYGYSLRDDYISSLLGY